MKTFAQWCLNPTFYYEDEYVIGHEDGRLEGKQFKTPFIYVDDRQHNPTETS